MQDECVTRHDDSKKSMHLRACTVSRLKKLDMLLS